MPARQKQIPSSQPFDAFSIRLSPEAFERWNRAALATGMTMKDWARHALDLKAREEFGLSVAEDQVPYGLPKKKRTMRKPDAAVA